MFKLFFKNKIVVYLLTRYCTYALQFIVSLIIAAKLGPYHLGVYGFFTLILNYFSQINLGIPHSLDVLLVHNKVDKEKSNNYIGNSFAIYGVVSVIIFIILLQIILLDIPISNKYPISEVDCLLIVIIAIFQYFSSLCSKILRVKNKVNQLAIAQSSLVLLNFLVILFFESESLIYALLGCQFIQLVIFILLTIKEKLIPNLKYIKYNQDIQREILYKGFFLFLYNSCFYFILITIRTLISGYYSVEEFGLFNFSYTIAHAVLLLIEALNMIIYPKIIDLLSSKDYEKIIIVIGNIRVSFVSTSHLLIYTAMLFFPLVVAFIPQFEGALTSMNLIALAILMNTNSYGYSSFLIAQNKEKISARISFLSLIINIVVAEILIKVFHVEFSYAILAIMVTYFCFSLMAVIEGRKIMGDFSIKNVLENFFPLRLLAPYLVALIISVVNCERLVFIPVLVYVGLNIKEIKQIFIFGKKLIENPNIADI